jgi:prepilin-type N-terminal cleavage/methylation domain-containing protein
MKILNKRQSGFTLIETLVAMSVFSILIVIVTGIYLNVNNLQKNTASFQRLQNEGRYITEKIAQEFRARELDVVTTFNGVTNPLDAVVFYEDEFDETVEIYYDNGVIRGGEVIPSLAYNSNGAVDYLNSVNTEVVGVRFYVWPSVDNPWGFAPATNIQPRLTFWLKIKNRGVAEKYRKELTIQTTISSKIYKR